MKQLGSQRGSIDIVLIVVVFVAAIAVGGYVYYRQQQANRVYDASSKGTTVAQHPTKRRALVAPASLDYSGWKTYSDKIYKLSFRYPADWSVKAFNTIDGDDSKSPSPLAYWGVYSPVANAGGLYLEVYRATQQSVVAAIIKDCTSDNICKLVSKENIEKSGAPGVLVTTINTTNDYHSKSYVVSANGFTYATRGSGDDDPVAVTAEQVFYSLQLK